MDRISALRNVEDALSAFENGEIDLQELQRRVQTVLQTYATEFSTGETAAYRVAVVERDRPVVVVAAGPGEARDRAGELTEVTPIEVERLGDPDRPD